MTRTRHVDRIYITFVVLIGTWSLWRYFTFCFSDCIYAITARSLIITTTTTQYTLGALGDKLIDPNTKQEGVYSIVTNGTNPALVKSLTRVDSRSPLEVKNAMRNAKKAKLDEKAAKKEQKAAAELAMAAAAAAGGGVVIQNGYIPYNNGNGNNKNGNKNVNANAPNTNANEKKINDALIAAQIPDKSGVRTSETTDTSTDVVLVGGEPTRRRRNTTKKTIVRPLTIKERFSPIVLRDLVWLLVSLFCTVMMVWSYFMAVTTDPGVVPKCFSVYAQKASRMALSTGGTLSKCTICQVFKPPRCHHCSKCGRCVLKYDHHCYWIGQCVGYFNYKVFLNFCFWTCLFTNIAYLSLARSVYLFFFEVVSSVTEGQNAIHALTETTTVYIRDSPVLGSTEVTKVPITPDIILLFFILLFAGWLSWFMTKKHYYLARGNKTTVEEMILDGDPSPYSLSTEHNWEEVFGDRNSPVKGALRWVHRLVPTLAYGRQKQSEIDSEEYFNLLKEEKRRQKLIRDYKAIGNYGAMGNTAAAGGTRPHPNNSGGGTAAVSISGGNRGGGSDGRGNRNAKSSSGGRGQSPTTMVGGGGADASANTNNRHVRISEKNNAIVAAGSPFSSFPSNGTSNISTPNHPSPQGRAGYPPTAAASNSVASTLHPSADEMSEGTISQPSSSDTDDEEKQTAKIQKRINNQTRLQKRADRRERYALRGSPGAGGRANPNNNSSTALFNNNGSSYSIGSSVAGEGMTPYNPPHTPPDRELTVGECTSLLLNVPRTGTSQYLEDGDPMEGHAPMHHTHEDGDGARRVPSTVLPHCAFDGRQMPEVDHEVIVLTPGLGGVGGVEGGEGGQGTDGRANGGGGGAIELCPQGTHFAKTMMDTDDEGADEEMRGLGGGGNVHP